MNDAARRIVGRCARVAGRDNAERLRLGADFDTVADEAWQQACQEYPEMAEWDGARQYFETILWRTTEGAAFLCTLSN